MNRILVSGSLDSLEVAADGTDATVIGAVIESGRPAAAALGQDHRHVFTASGTIAASTATPSCGPGDLFELECELVYRTLPASSSAHCRSAATRVTSFRRLVRLGPNLPIPPPSVPAS